ncbi:hypothetical protein NSERUTF1_1109 [Nocardia seriolae]|nr:hypothetical protein NSERUTF1_1109 [Nocardia seriolae]
MNSSCTSGQERDRDGEHTDHHGHAANPHGRARSDRLPPPSRHVYSLAGRSILYPGIGRVAKKRNAGLRGLRLSSHHVFTGGAADHRAS